MAVAAIAIGAATVFSILQQRKQAESQEKQLRQSAATKREQAMELIERSEFNIDQLQEEVELFKATQEGALIKGGLQAGSQLSLILLEQTNRDLMDEIAAQRHEARYKANTLLRGGEIELSLIGDLRKASMFNQGATALEGFGSIMGKMPPSTPSTPKRANAGGVNSNFQTGISVGQQPSAGVAGGP